MSKSVLLLFLATAAVFSGCTAATQFAIVPPVLPTVLPRAAGPNSPPVDPDFALNVGVMGIQPGANLVVDVDPEYVVDGTKCSQATLLLPVVANSDGKWGATDVLLGSKDSKCRCLKDHCTGFVRMQIKDLATNQFISGDLKNGEHTALRVTWDASGDLKKMKVTDHQP